MTQHSSTPRPAANLRERRRRELSRTIAAAAVELFEHEGFAATTVDDIAAAAGISRTTFFRHCATKEAAVLVDDAGLEPELVTAAALVSPLHPLRELEATWERMTTVFDADPQGHDRFLRVRRLMAHNPPLLGAALERDAQLTAQIAATLADKPALSALDAHAIAESFALGMRLAFDEWARVADATGTPPPLGEVYARVRAALRRATTSSDA